MAAEKATMNWGGPVGSIIAAGLLVAGVIFTAAIVLLSVRVFGWVWAL